TPKRAPRVSDFSVDKMRLVFRPNVGVKPRGLSLLSEILGQESKLKPRRLERKVRPNARGAFYARQFVRPHQDSAANRSLKTADARPCVNTTATVIASRPSIRGANAPYPRSSPFDPPPKPRPGTPKCLSTSRTVIPSATG